MIGAKTLPAPPRQRNPKTGKRLHADSHTSAWPCGDVQALLPCWRSPGCIGCVHPHYAGSVSLTWPLVLCQSLYAHSIRKTQGLASHPSPRAL